MNENFFDYYAQCELLLIAPNIMITTVCLKQKKTY